MQRTLLVALSTVVLAAAIAAGTTIILTGDDELPATSPVLTSPPPAATSSRIAEPTSGPVATDGGSEPVSTGGVTPSQATSAASVDCSQEPTLCSDTTGAMEVDGGALVTASAAKTQTDYSSVPNFAMRSKALRPGGEQAARGNEVQMLHVDVTIRNDTQTTFVFPRREIVLDVYRDGRLYDRLITKGEGFEMVPGGEMRGKFDQPITRDGTYTWQAKTWYRAK